MGIPLSRDERLAKNRERAAAAQQKQAGRVDASRAAAGRDPLDRTQRGFHTVEPLTPGIESGGGFSTPPSMPGIPMDGGTPQAFPPRPPLTSDPRLPPGGMLGRPAPGMVGPREAGPSGQGVSAPGQAAQAFPRPAPQPMPPTMQGRPAAPPPASAPRIPPMPGQAAPAPGGLPQNLPVPPGGGGGWGPGMAGTPGQTGPAVQASPFAGVRPMGVGADPYSKGSTARPAGSGWKNPGQGMPPMGKQLPVTLDGPPRFIRTTQGPGGSSSTRTQY